MADILSLSKARKARAKADKEQQAQENRIRFGRTKAERDVETAKAEKAERLIAAHRRGDPDEPGR